MVLLNNLRGGVFRGSEPFVVTAVNVLAPAIGAEIEVLREQPGKLGRGFPGEDAFHNVLVTCISLRLVQEDPLARF